MSWFDDFKRELTQLGYVRLISDLPLNAHGDLIWYGNWEAFYYKNQKEPRLDTWGPGLWRLLDRPQYAFLRGGAGNGRDGVHQYQVQIPADRMVPELIGYTVWDFRDEMRERSLASPIFSYTVPVVCRTCGGVGDVDSAWRTGFAKQFMGRCDSCRYGDD